MKLNINQKKLYGELLINLSTALLSISIFSPIISRVKIDGFLLIVFFLATILSLLMILYSIYLLRK